MEIVRSGDCVTVMVAELVLLPGVLSSPVRVATFVIEAGAFAAICAVTRMVCVVVLGAIDVDRTQVNDVPPPAIVQLQLEPVASVTVKPGGIVSVTVVTVCVDKV